MIRLITLFLCLATFSSIANEYDFSGDLKKKKFVINRRKKFPAGFNLYALGPIGVASASFDYFITPKLSLEVGGGFRNFDGDIGYMIGGRYHFFGKTTVNITPFIGVFSGFEQTGSSIKNYNFYIPVGFQRVKKKRVSWTVELAYQHNSYKKDQKFYGGFKIGYRFGFKIDHRFRLKNKG